ncbi:MAG: hypothetical protein IKQ51_09835 [Bacteroidaceae bacterium]|nr:hypothetical protein [Bacteroidaceae bacterium]
MTRIERINPFNRLAQDTAKGIGVGFCFFVCVVSIMMLLGLYRISSIGTVVNS